MCLENDKYGVFHVQITLIAVDVNHLFAVSKWFFCKIWFYKVQIKYFHKNCSSQMNDKLITHGAVVVAQLAERPLPTPERSAVRIKSSAKFNITFIYFQLCWIDENKERKEAGNNYILTLGLVVTACVPSTLTILVWIPGSGHIQKVTYSSCYSKSLFLMNKREKIINRNKNSVTRLGNLQKFLFTNVLKNIAQILQNFFGYFQKQLFYVETAFATFWATYEKCRAIVLFQHLVTLNRNHNLEYVRR